MFITQASSFTMALFLAAAMSGFCAEPARKTLRDHVPSVVARLASQGNLPESNRLSLAIGLPFGCDNSTKLFSPPPQPPSLQHCRDIS